MTLYKKGDVMKQLELDYQAYNYTDTSKSAWVNKKDKLVKGFNIGINTGEVAGQTIFHCHIHLIPRRKGDVKDPRGGVRGVIPSKQKYDRR